MNVLPARAVLLAGSKCPGTEFKVSPIVFPDTITVALLRIGALHEYLLIHDKAQLLDNGHPDLFTLLDHVPHKIRSAESRLFSKGFQPFLEVGVPVCFFKSEHFLRQLKSRVKDLFWG